MTEPRHFRPLNRVKLPGFRTEGVLARQWVAFAGRTVLHRRCAPCGQCWIRTSGLRFFTPTLYATELTVHNPTGGRSPCRGLATPNAIRVRGGGQTRTGDLRIMSPASYRLLHSALSLGGLPPSQARRIPDAPAIPTGLEPAIFTLTG